MPKNRLFTEAFTCYIWAAMPWALMLVRSVSLALAFIRLEL
ncbi:MAG TPA: hypothetical protein PLN07_04240 [Myxococcota bacterium]|nr:hypothetical protein [Myxococcota bacterium]